MTDAANLLIENQTLKEKVEQRDILIALLEEKLRLADIAKFSAIYCVKILFTTFQKTIKYARKTALCSSVSAVMIMSSWILSPRK